MNLSSILPLFGFSKLSVVLFLPVSLSRRAVKQWKENNEKALYCLKTVLFLRVMSKAHLCLCAFWNICWSEHENCFLLATTGRFVFIITFIPSWIAALLLMSIYCWLHLLPFLPFPPPSTFKTKGSLTPSHSKVRNIDILRNLSHFSSKIIW